MNCEKIKELLEKQLELLCKKSENCEALELCSVNNEILKTLQVFMDNGFHRS